MEWIWLIVGLALGVFIGYLAAVARRPRDQEANQLRVELAAQLARCDELSRENGDLKRRFEADMDVLTAMAPLAAKVNDMSRQLAVGEQQRAGQYAALGEQLRATQAGGDRLREATEQLAGALRSGSARGMWGEVELRRVLEAAGMMRHIDFSEQTTTAAGSRPDVVVHLPGGKHVVVDAKVPFDSYLAAVRTPDAGTPDAVERQRALYAAHAKALKAHIDALSAKEYHRGLVGSAELTVLFLPAEPLLAVALDAEPGLLDYSLQRGVVPATPATLLALLKTVAVMWQEVEVAEDARRLLELGRTLYQRLAVLGTNLTKLGSAIESSVTAYNRVIGSLESRVLSAARAFEALDSSGLAVSELDSERASIRHIVRSELIEPSDLLEPEAERADEAESSTA